MDKRTVGTLAQEVQKNDAAPNAHEQMQEQLSEYDKNIFTCLEQGLSRYKSSFYIVVLTKKERLLSNVIRNYFFNRLSCPTPDYDQAVYRYDHNQKIIEFLWVIPSRHTCYMMKQYPLEIPSEEKQLLQFVMDFDAGTLYTKARLLNKEQESDLVLINA